MILGMWQKYPNPATSHVISVDTIDRSVDPVTGIIRSCVRAAYALAALPLAGPPCWLGVRCRG